jgi:hypothetical protein
MVDCLLVEHRKRMMDVLSQSVGPFKGLIGVAREEITPPVGIYARCWGAAKQDVATGVHRPLTLTCLSIQSSEKDQPLILMTADLMYWQRRDDEWALRSAILKALSLDESRLMFSFAHTHSAPSLSSDDVGKPGGNLIGPYRISVRDAAIRAAKRALETRQSAILEWRYGTCDLARNRDLPVAGENRFACGFNPDGPSEQTLLVGRIVDAETHDRVIAMIVNYACHPTTLAWENSLISPDFPGAMCEVVELQTQAPCLFLQGASAELAPAEQYVGDTAIADRHGRQLGFAVLSCLSAMEAPLHRLVHKGVVESGTALAMWRQERVEQLAIDVASKRTSVSLVLKPMPSTAELEKQLQKCTDRVLGERLARQRAVRRTVGEGSSWDMPLWVWRIGDALLVGQPNEAYSVFQTEIRRRFAPRPVVVMNLVNGACGYLPPRDLYGQQLYQVWQTPFERGSLERLIETAGESLQSIVNRKTEP